MTTRFIGQRLPKDFYNDWRSVADDESQHFLMLRNRLAQQGSAWGNFPAYDGLSRAADATKNDLLARLAIAPLVSRQGG